MSLNLKKFVNIDINHVKEQILSMNFDTAVLLYQNPENESYMFDDYFRRDNLENTSTMYVGEKRQFIYSTLKCFNYVKTFFDFGGKVLHVKSIKSTDTAESIVNSLPKNEIVIFTNETVSIVSDERERREDKQIETSTSLLTKNFTKTLEGETQEEITAENIIGTYTNTDGDLTSTVTVDATTIRFELSFIENSYLCSKSFTVGYTIDETDGVVISDVANNVNSFSATIADNVITLSTSISKIGATYTQVTIETHYTNTATWFTSLLLVTEQLTGIDRKIIVGYTNDYSVIDTTNRLIKSINGDLLHNVVSLESDNAVLKYAASVRESDYKDLTYKPETIHATIAAYLTKININSADSVKDYMFTTETGLEKFIASDTASDKMFVDPSNSNSVVKINFLADLVNKCKVVGGNTTSGSDLVNEYMLIVLQQTLTSKLVSALASKLKYNNSTLAQLSSIITVELNRYVRNGFLMTDKIYTSGDIVIQNQVLLTKNTPLTDGYKFVIMPFSTLTPEERAQHKLPNIYMVLAESYSIRYISISGLIY